MDAVPGFSQIKSIVQRISGNNIGAQQTEDNFRRLCPFVSQLTSLDQLFHGDRVGAKETQITFVKGLCSMVDSVPAIGHIKAVGHYICGDREGARKAMNAANHTTGVMAGGAVGFAVGGPMGAAVGGALAGAAVDVGISIQTDRPYGHVDKLCHIINAPSDGGNYVDLVGGVILDGMTGVAAGTLFEEQIKPRLSKRKLANDMLDAGESMNEFRVNKRIKCNSDDVMTQAKDQIRIPDGPTELQIRANDVKQESTRSIWTIADQQVYNDVITDRPSAASGNSVIVSVTTCHESQTIVNISLSENSSAMGTLLPLAVVASAGAAITSAGVRSGVIAREEPY